MARVPPAPRQQALRAAAVAVVLFLLVWVVAVRPGQVDVATTGTLCGALFVLLGYASWIGPKPGGR